MPKDVEQATPQDRARRLIGEATHMTIASVGDAGTPWVSPVFFSPDEACNLYWVSDVEARHSQNVRGNPTVAIVIYEWLDEQLDAAYFTAEVEELETPDA